MLLNARSLANKLGEFHFLVNQTSPAIVAVCETCITNNIPDQLINCNNSYYVFRKDRPTHGGGVCLLVSKSLNVNVELVQHDVK
jgi:hypothetical protein